MLAEFSPRLDVANLDIVTSIGIIPKSPSDLVFRLDIFLELVFVCKGVEIGKDLLA